MAQDFVVSPGRSSLLAAKQTNDILTSLIAVPMYVWGGTSVFHY